MMCKVVYAKECRKQFERRYGKSAQVGIPYSKALVEFGGEVALKDAIARGDATVVVDQGKEFYSWKTIEVGKEKRIHIYRHEFCLHTYTKGKH